MNSAFRVTKIKVIRQKQEQTEKEFKIEERFLNVMGVCRRSRENAYFTV